ncbi:MAG: plastocyanin/azurin family copper-binding protein [Balneolaceae bacterium]|nr:plastocyanin/azurin family copper-binding protein [Balneolaceae bacterium]
MKKLYLFFPVLTLIFFTAFSSALDQKDDINKDTPAVKTINAEPAATVGMTNTMKFTPDTVRIDVGETVEWTNSSLLAHTVTGDPSKAAIEGSVQLPEGSKAFDSGMLSPDQTFTHTFKKAGTYKYFCIPHEATKMYGWVIVEE